MTYQAIIGGLDLTGLDAFGVEWTVNPDFDGWAGSTSSTIRVQQNARRSGGSAGAAFSTSRHISVAGLIIAPTQAALESAFDRLNAAVSLSETTFVTVSPVGTRIQKVRQEDRVIPNFLTDVVAEYSFQLVAPDPRKFAPAVSASTGLPSSSGGLAVPFAAPFAIGAMSVSGQVTLVNVGNEVGPVTLRIDGPVNGPSITHLGSGRVLTFSSVLSLGVGEWLDVDMEARTVLANGQSSRSGYVTSRGWSSFEVGSNTWSFTAASFSAGALLTVSAVPSFK